MFIIPPQYRALAYVIGIALIFGIGFGSGFFVEHTRWNSADASAVKNAAKIETDQRTDSAKVETQYVDRIKTVTVPVDRIRDRIVHAACRVPDAADRAAVPASDAAQPNDAAARTDTDAGLIGGIATEAGACVRNRIQLEQLQALIRANSAKPE